MKKYNFKNIIRIASAVLICLCLAFVLSACNKQETPPKEETETAEPLVEVIRVVKSVKAGEQITEDDVELVGLRAEDIPFNPVKVAADAIGKYATVDLYVGDFITNAKLSAQDPKDAELPIDEAKYILITQYASLASGGDYTAAIKKAIEENPNGTIYFPDGIYEISDTVVIPANNAKSVSIRLSNYATLKAVNWSDKSKPMIRMGVCGEGEDTENIGGIDHSARNVYFMGGVIDASGIASGITVEGSEDILLSNFTVKNSYIGVNLIDPKNSTNSTSADIENVHVVGNGEKGSIGILVGSSLNTLANMRVSGVQYGMKCTENGSNNLFRSIHAIGTGLEEIDNAGFWDMSGGNQYDVCYSDQFATGFLIDERARSTYNSCTCSWRSADNGYHVGFRAIGRFNSNISYSKVSHTHEVETDAYLLVETDGGTGSVYYPFDMTVSDKYASVLKKYCSTDILN
ncbi:MAG: hypothetical protein E7642_04345 [Ruminococcaceae bacterium]|nr:hypothetical protein [Oscillospiraceae bacterium]